MKRYLRPPFTALLFTLTMGIMPSQAWADCQTCATNLKLPPANVIYAGLTQNTVLSAPSYLTATIYESGAGMDIHDGDYLAWCADSPTGLLDNGPDPATPISSYSTLNPMRSPNWDKVNFLLNHKDPGATFHDIQRDIWLLLGQTPTARFPETGISLAMLNLALASGTGFVPAAGQIVGVILGQDGPGGVQDTMIEIPAPACGTIGDYVFQDTDRNGLQNQGDTGINGVTVKLTDAAGALLATTVTAATPAGYPYLTPGAPGYYQFPGWGACTYKVVIDDAQPALAGFTPTSPLVGGGANAATDSNHTSGDLIVLATDTSVDETIDFGYVAASPMTVTCAPGPGAIHTSYSYTIAVTGGVPRYTFTLDSGTPPAGLSLDAMTGNVSGTPSAYGSSSFGVQVQDATGQPAGTKVTTCTIDIAAPPLSVQCAPATTGQQGVSYSSAIAATGGTGGYQYSVVGGALPTGLTLNASTGLILGTPAGFGTSVYQIQAKDSAGTIATTGATSCTLAIAPPPPTAECGTCTSNKATVGVAYSAKMTATGGCGTGYTYALDTGSILPPGLTLNSATGAITGTPTAPGSYIVSTVVTDSMGGTDTVSCTINVSGPPLSLDCGSCGGNRATIGSAYTSALAATGGRPGYTYSISYGSLPAGLTLNAATGMIAGAPTATGYFSFTSKVVDANGIVDTARCTIYVAQSPVNLDCASCGSSRVNVGVSYNSKVTATGGKPAYTYSIVSGSLPVGLTLNAVTGAIAGTPTAPGTFTFTSKVVDANGYTDTATCTITVAGAPVNLECGVCGAGSAKVGTAFTAAFALSGGKAPYTYAVTSGSLPPGLTLSAAGVINGAPTTAGTYLFTTTVTDAYGSKDTASCTIVVTGSAINLDCGACKSGKATLGAAYSNTLQVTGAYGSVTFSIVGGSLPAGLTLGSTTGKIGGTPSAAGTFTFTSQVKDSQGHVDTDMCTITVAAIPLDIQCGSCSAGNGTVGNSYSATFGVTGGVAGYTFSIATGSLPAGLILNTATGVIAGTPSTAGAATFTVKVKDGKGTTDTVTCTIAVAAIPLDIQCGTCGANRATAGTAYSVTLAATGGSGGYTYSIASGALPAGVTLNATTGAIAGLPSAPGTYTFTSQVKDAKGKTDTATCTINVVGSPVNLDCGTCGANKAQLGAAYSSTLKPTGGIGSYSYSITAGSLPAGLSLNAYTGVIGGTPVADGSYAFTSKATDSKGNSDTADCTIVVMGYIKAGDYVTYSQGGWGASPNGHNTGTLLKNNFGKVYRTGSVSIGGTRQLTFTSSAAISAFLPQGGTPGVLSASAFNPTGSAANVFAGQVLALQLSVDFSSRGVTPGGLANLKLNSGPLSGQTIAQVLALANSVLGGNIAALPAGLTVPGLNDILDSINGNFDGGSTNGGCAH